VRVVASKLNLRFLLNVPLPSVAQVAEASTEEVEFVVRSVSDCFDKELRHVAVRDDHWDATGRTFFESKVIYLSINYVSSSLMIMYTKGSFLCGERTRHSIRFAIFSIQISQCTQQSSASTICHPSRSLNNHH